MIGARWPGSVGIWSVRRPAFTSLVVADGEIPRDEVNFLPVFVHEWLGGVDAGRKAEQTRARAALVVFVERPRQDFLLDTGRIAGWRFPAGGHVDGVEFLMFLVDAHESVSFCSIRCL